MRTRWHLALFLPVAIMLCNCSSGDGNTPLSIDTPAIITVSGNGIAIASNDTSPSTADGTDFGTLRVMGSEFESDEQAFTICNKGLDPITLNSSTVTISGDPGLTLVPFTATTLNKDQCAIIRVRFEPSPDTSESATLTIAPGGGVNPFSFALAGTGDGVGNFEVSGNGTLITNGDTTPDVADDTDYGLAVLRFGSAAVEHTFTITNNDDETLTITKLTADPVAGNFGIFGSLTTIPLTIDAGMSADLIMRYAPTEISAADTIDLFLETDHPFIANYVFRITGAAEDGPLEVSGGDPLTLIPDDSTAPTTTDGTDFGTIRAGLSSEEQSFEFLNASSGAITLTGSPTITIEGAAKDDFVVTILPADGTLVDSGVLFPFGVVYAPTAGSAATATATVVIATDSTDPEKAEYRFDITGQTFEGPLEVRGGTPFVAIPDNSTTPNLTDGTDFGSVRSGMQSEEQIFELDNETPGTITLTGTPAIDIIGADAADFTVTTIPATSTLGIDTIITFGITYAPSTSSSATAAATVVIANDSSDSDLADYRFDITATNETPHLQVSGNGIAIARSDNTPDVLDGTRFDATKIGTTATQTFTITNVSGVTTTLTNGALEDLVQLTGASAAVFSLVSGSAPPSTLGPGATFDFDIAFTPVDLNSENVTIVIAHDDDDEPPYQFIIDGTGTGAIVELREDNGSGAVIPKDGSGSFDVGEVNVIDAVVNNGTGTIRLTNVGNDPLLFAATPLTIGGADAGSFAATMPGGFPGFILAGANVDITVTADVDEERSYAGTLTLQLTEIPDVTLNLTATGILGKMSVVEVDTDTPIADGDSTPDAADGTLLTAPANELDQSSFEIRNDDPTVDLLIGEPLGRTERVDIIHPTLAFTSQSISGSTIFLEAVSAGDLETELTTLRAGDRITVAGAHANDGQSATVTDVTFNSTTGLGELSYAGTIAQVENRNFDVVAANPNDNSITISGATVTDLAAGDRIELTDARYTGSSLVFDVASIVNATTMTVSGSLAELAQSYAVTAVDIGTDTITLTTDAWFADVDVGDRITYQGTNYTIESISGSDVTVTGNVTDDTGTTAIITKIPTAVPPAIAYPLDTITVEKIDFVVVTQPPQSIAGDQVGILTILYDPRGEGVTSTAEVQIHTNADFDPSTDPLDVDNIFNFTIEGIGTAPSPPPLLSDG